MAITGQISNRSRLGLRRGVPTREMKFDSAVLDDRDGDNFTLFELTRHGALLKTDAELGVKEPLAIRHCGLHDVIARVTWVGDNFAACEFSRALKLGELRDIRLEKTRRPTDAKVEPENEAVNDEIELGERIRRLRLEKCYSMVHFASVVGVSKPTLRRWEANTALPAANSLRRIASALNCTEFELLYGIPRA